MHHLQMVTENLLTNTEDTVETSQSFTYAQHLDILCVESHELWRLKFDLIMIYCIVYGLNALEFSDFFNFWFLYYPWSSTQADETG